MSLIHSFFLYFFVFLCQRAQSSQIELFISPYNPYNPCAPSGTRACSGSIASPLDSISSAIAMSLQIYSQTSQLSLVFNLITNVDGIFTLIPSDSYQLRSPFALFPGIIFNHFQLESHQNVGSILIRAMNIISYFPFSYQNSLAKIYLGSDYFTFEIYGSLTLIGTVFLGFDMHMDLVPCSLRPVVAACSCGSQLPLTNPKSSCYINRPYVPLFSGKSYPGFIQLGHYFFG